MAVSYIHCQISWEGWAGEGEADAFSLDIFQENHRCIFHTVAKQGPLHMGETAGQQMGINVYVYDYIC